MLQKFYNMPLHVAIREIPLSVLFQILEESKNTDFALAAYRAALLYRRVSNEQSISPSA